VRFLRQSHNFNLFLELDVTVRVVRQQSSLNGAMERAMSNNEVHFKERDRVDDRRREKKWVRWTNQEFDQSLENLTIQKEFSKSNSIDLKEKKRD
jgi:hypothetical protein